MTDYPEHEKLEAVNEKSQAIGEFLEFVASEYGWHLRVWGATWDERLHWPVGLYEGREPNPYVLGPPELRRHTLRHEYQMIGGSISDHLARYFDIDLVVLEAEKRALLDAIRAAH